MPCVLMLADRGSLRVSLGSHLHKLPGSGTCCLSSVANRHVDARPLQVRYSVTLPARRCCPGTSPNIHSSFGTHPSDISFSDAGSSAEQMEALTGLRGLARNCGSVLEPHYDDIIQTAHVLLAKTTSSGGHPVTGINALCQRATCTSPLASYAHVVCFLVVMS